MMQADAILLVDSIRQMVKVIQRFLPSHHADNFMRSIFEHEVSQLRANLSSDSGD
jgi:hypothetical protein